MKINFREASTKRAIVMTVTGCITLYNIIFGSGASDVDVLVQRVEFWLGTGLTIVGMFGFLPDQPTRDPQERTRETDIPSISLVGKSESDEYTGPARAIPPNIAPIDAGESYDQYLARVRTASLQSNHESQDPRSTLRQDGSGYNG
jgi:hypothetical protein